MAVELRTRRLSRPTACEVPALDSGRGGITGPASLSLTLGNGSTRRRQPGPLMTLAAREAELPGVSPVRLLFRRPLALLSLMPVELSTFIAGGVAGAIAKTTTAPLDRVRAAAAAPAAAPPARAQRAYRARPQVKILLQVSSVNAQSAAAKAAAKGGLISTFVEIGKTEGIRGYWRGNIPQVRLGASSNGGAAFARAHRPRHSHQVLRVLPYSACQLYRRVRCAAPLRGLAADAREARSYEKLKKLLADKDGNLSVPARLAAGAGAACVSTIVRARRARRFCCVRAR